MDIHCISLKGLREQNEDKHNVVLNIDGKKDNIANVNLYSVYDGHGGKFVSKYLSEHLPNYFTDKRVPYPNIENKYILGVYTQLEKDLKENHQKSATHCGSTCLVALQYKNNNSDHLIIMNTGDCRAVLCRDNFGIPLTIDHKPHYPKEKRRIEKLGGKIYNDGLDYRIKDLSVSRAFGDFDAQPYVVCNPDIFRHKLDKNDKFLILGCDGLWDVISNQEAINFVLNETYDDNLEKRINNKNNGKTINIARKLAEKALLLGSQDNLTIIIIFFE